MLNNDQETFFDYWKSLPRDAHALVPCRSSLTLQGLGRLASKIAITEYESRNSLVFRLAGTEVEEQRGEQQKGINVFDKCEAGSILFFQKLWQDFFTCPAGLSHQYQYHSTRASHVVYSGLHLPLTDNNGDVRFKIALFIQKNSKLSPDASTPGWYDTRMMRNMHWHDIGAGVPDFDYTKNDL